MSSSLKAGSRGDLKLHLFPRSLRNQNALLLIVLVLLVEFLTTILFALSTERPRLVQSASVAARQIAATKAALEAVPEPWRQQTLDLLNTRMAMHIEPAVPRTLVSGETPSPFQRAFIYLVRVFLIPQGSDLYNLQSVDGKIQVNFSANDSPYVVRFTQAMDLRHSQSQLVLVLLTVTAFGFLGGWVIYKRVNRPLSRLIAASHMIGAGQTPGPVSEDGPLEIAIVSKSFNQMMNDLHEMNEIRALMLAGVSHDLRTPLTKLGIAVGIVGNRIDPALAQAMELHIEEIDGLIGQFLDFARPENQEPMQQEDLSELIRLVAANYKRRGTPFRIVAEAPLYLRCRPMALRRLLTNLMENAIKYAHDEDGEREVRAARVGATIVLSVLDRGPGIAPDQVEHIKRPFVRGDVARGAQPGSGLGLAIVERAVAAHGGRLDLLARDDGPGLEARVTLPAADVTDVTDDSDAQADTPA